MAGGDSVRGTFARDEREARRIRPMAAGGRRSRNSRIPDGVISKLRGGVDRTAQLFAEGESDREREAGGESAGALANPEREFCNEPVSFVGHGGRWFDARVDAFARRHTRSHRAVVAFGNDAG